MAPSIIPDALGAVAGLAAGVYTSAADRKAQEDAQRFALSSYKHRYQWQVEDMRKAGLNPALAYGQSPGSGAQTVAPAQPGTSFMKGATGAAQAAAQLASSRLTNAQTTLLEAQTADLIDQVKLRNAEIYTHTAQMGASASLTMMQQDQLQLVMKGLEYDNEFKKATLDNRVEIVKKELEKKGVDISYLQVQKALGELALPYARAEADYYKGIGRYSPMVNDAMGLLRQIKTFNLNLGGKGEPTWQPSSRTTTQGRRGTSVRTTETFR